MAGVVDPSEIKSSVAGTGMTKPGFFDGLSLPSFDPWQSWMSFLQLSIFKLRELTGSFGLAIICIVLCVKAVTYPLNYKVYSAQFEMQAIQPEIERIKEEFKDNPDLINLRTSVLFQEKSVNPLAGCLPVLIQFPIFVGLYRTLLNLGKDRKLEEPFLFLPSLEGPVVAGLPTDYVGVREDAPWLLQNWVDGVPPLGWHDTAIYCVIPALLVIVQLVSAEITKQGQPKKPASAQQGDGSIETLVAFLPFLIGWFALNLPSGCALYWLVNTVFTIAQQTYIKGLFKPQLEAAAAVAAVHAGDSPAVVTDAERKIAEQATQEGWIRGLKEVYTKFDSFLGAGLPSEAELEQQAAARKLKEAEEAGPNIFQADYWIREKPNPAALQLKKEDIDEVKAKFLAAREARKAKKAGAATLASSTAADAVGAAADSDA